MRFVPPMVLLADGPVSFDGDEGARVRPMGALLDALRALGAVVDDEGTGTLPFTVTPGPIATHEVTIDASASSQFVTGLLLVAPRLPGGLTIRHQGEHLPSLPHIDMTCAALRDAGVRVDQPDQTTWVVHPGPISLGDVRVEPDLSNAGPFLAAAMVAGGTVRIPGWPSVDHAAGGDVSRAVGANGRAMLAGRRRAERDRYGRYRWYRGGSERRGRDHAHHRGAVRACGRAVAADGDRPLARSRDGPARGNRGRGGARWRALPRGRRLSEVRGATCWWAAAGGHGDLSRSPNGDLCGNPWARGAGAPGARRGHDGEDHARLPCHVARDARSGDARS